jgi:phosphate-selective porin
MMRRIVLALATLGVVLGAVAAPAQAAGTALPDGPPMCCSGA